MNKTKANLTDAFDVIMEADAAGVTDHAGKSDADLMLDVIKAAAPALADKAEARSDSPDYLAGLFDVAREQIAAKSDTGDKLLAAAKGAERADTGGADPVAAAQARMLERLANPTAEGK